MVTTSDLDILKVNLDIWSILVLGPRKAYNVAF